MSSWEWAGKSLVDEIARDVERRMLFDEIARDVERRMLFGSPPISDTGWYYRTFLRGAKAIVCWQIVYLPPDPLD